jgi:hypothetical protein
VVGYCEHGNEPSGSMKCGEFLDWVRNYYFFKYEYPVELVR